ncbi:hypothetical protein MKX08_004155 [Trichoderma sp. CBMAI-0020]|nr:hypothetical protein MKX08_004155 [Trichoderma sp. CBMAI-0020]
MDRQLCVFFDACKYLFFKVGNVDIQTACLFEDHVHQCYASLDYALEVFMILYSSSLVVMAKLKSFVHEHSEAASSIGAQDPIPVPHIIAKRDDAIDQGVEDSSIDLDCCFGDQEPLDLVLVRRLASCVGFRRSAMDVICNRSNTGFVEEDFHTLDVE